MSLSDGLDLILFVILVGMAVDLTLVVKRRDRRRAEQSQG